VNGDQGRGLPSAEQCYGTGLTEPPEDHSSPQEDFELYDYIYCRNFAEYQTTVDLTK
jgi:hypothetical protein